MLAPAPVRHRRRLGALAGVAALAPAAAASAGPPYLSDDPQPTDTGHWEIYNFVSGARGPSGLGGEAGVDLNYGGARDLQLTAVLPSAFDDPRGSGPGGLRTGPGTLELAAKYRFLHQAEGNWTPDVSVFPRLFVPTAGRRFGTGHADLLLPVWAQKDFGPWSVFGGGGYTINPGSGRRDYWQGGVAASRALTKRLSIGAEVFGQGRDTDQGGGFQALNVALTYSLTKHWSLLASTGSTRSTDGHGQVFYLSLKADY